MEFTEVELIYIYNAIELHQSDVQDALIDLKGKIKKQPLAFFENLQTIETTSNGLKTACDLQLRILPLTESTSDEEAVVALLEKRKAWIQETRASFKNILKEAVDKIDE